MLLYHDKRPLTNDVMSGNPNKKIRLDFHDRAEGSAGNDDLWGQDDFTAEEFDMLEVQATQSCNQTVSYPNHNAHQINVVNFDGPNSVSQVGGLKHLQYELEGRVKLLSHSLEKSTKELNEERANREKIINDRMQVCKLRENDLQKNVEKLQSDLDFKEQEMKSVCSKLQVLKAQQTQERKISCAETSTNKNFEDFLVSFKPCHKQVERSKITSTYKFCRKHKLFVDAPRDNTESVDILSSILCSRLAIPSFSSSENLTNSAPSIDTLSNINFSPMSVVQLNRQQNSDELLEYYTFCLKCHIAYLKTAAGSNSGISIKASPMSARRKETNWVSPETVISCIRDTIYTLSAVKFDLGLQKSEDTKHAPSSSKSKQKLSYDKESSLNFSDGDSGKKHESVINMDILSGILETLLTLANPMTFPNGYPQTEEIELSLSALFIISLTYPKIFLENVPELPLQSLQRPHQSVTSICITLKLIISLSSSPNFAPFLFHKASNCVLCSIAAFLCGTLHPSPEKYAVSMLLIEDFLSSVLSVHSIIGDQLDTAPCITEVIKGVVISLWKYYQSNDQNSYSMLIIKKGFILLHFMSSSIPSFKERRSQVEDEYISLISSVLTLSKENVEFREYYDLIHNLWDFQTDVSEFDLDEASDDTQSSTNEMDVTDSN